MEKVAIFGAGHYGARALAFIGKEKVAFFIDNSMQKQQMGYCGLEVLPLDRALVRTEASLIIIAAANIHADEIRKQLDENHVKNYETFNELVQKVTREKLQQRPDYLSMYRKAIGWVHENTILNKGIINNSKLRESYPEVTGYYIPTLLRWGYKELAVSYAQWLCSIQHEDGAWYDTENKYPYIFDSAQILKGLIAVRGLYPDVDEHIIKGCDWILGNMTSEGRLVSPLKDAWGDGKTYSELIHTYCISPIKEAGKIFNRSDYIEKSEKIAHYYTTECKDQILNFDLLSHFYAYVMEAMLDIGREDLAKTAMARIACLQKKSGAVPAYKNVDWVCSTGLFQFSVVWYRLGDIEHGDKAFQYACRLQNESGGWYGSYLSEENSGEVNNYFPDAEISWAVKYFLDALSYKNLALFEKQAPIFGNEIKETDGRYQCVRKRIQEMGKNRKVLDIGCGKGRYIKRLAAEFPDNEYYAVDLSFSVMEYFQDCNIKKAQGSLTDIPYANHSFDIAYVCEALEHAVDIESAVRELCRVVKNGGLVVIVDKNKEKLGYFDIEDWEQWFDEMELKEILLKYCSDVEVVKNISFDDEPANGLFYCWTGRVKKV